MEIDSTYESFEDSTNTLQTSGTIQHELVKNSNDGYAYLTVTLPNLPGNVMIKWYVLKIEFDGTIISQENKDDKTWIAMQDDRGVFELRKIADPNGFASQTIRFRLSNVKPSVEPTIHLELQDEDRSVIGSFQEKSMSQPGTDFIHQIQTTSTTIQVDMNMNPSSPGDAVLTVVLDLPGVGIGNDDWQYILKIEFDGFIEIQKNTDDNMWKADEREGQKAGNCSNSRDQLK